MTAEANDDAQPDTVESFNGRSGAVVPAEGDYTAAMVGARPDTWLPSASDISAVTSTTITTIVKLTQTEYDQLNVKDAATLYLIEE